MVRSKVKSFRMIRTRAHKKVSYVSQLSFEAVNRITHAIFGQQIINDSLGANNVTSLYGRVAPNISFGEIFNNEMEIVLNAAL